MESVVLNYQQSITAMVETIALDIRNSFPKMEAASDRLADLGWTIPMLLTPKEFMALADSSYTDEEVDTGLSGFYTDGDHEHLREVQTALLNSAALSPWRGVLSEAFHAFYLGHFQIVVPALLVVTEGVIAMQSGNLNAAVVGVRKMAAETKAKQDPQTWDALTWRSIGRWTDHLFLNSHFSGPKPPTLNRHWILHGRDAGPWASADAVRLFAALHTIS